jgi:hypothetical protein
MFYVIGAMPIFCKAVKINFLEVKEAKNAFGFDSNKWFIAGCCGMGSYGSGLTYQTGTDLPNIN